MSDKKITIHTRNGFFLDFLKNHKVKIGVLHEFF